MQSRPYVERSCLPTVGSNRPDSPSPRPAVSIRTARLEPAPGHRLLEIGLAVGDGVEFIMHAMAARDRYLR